MQIIPPNAENTSPNAENTPPYAENTPPNAENTLPTAASVPPEAGNNQLAWLNKGSAVELSLDFLLRVNVGSRCSKSSIYIPKAKRVSSS